MKIYLSVAIAYHPETGVLVFKRKQDNHFLEFPFYQTTPDLAIQFKQKDVRFYNLPIKSVKNDRYTYTYNISDSVELIVESIYLLSEFKSMYCAETGEDYEEIKIFRFNKPFLIGTIEPIYRPAVQHLYNELFGLEENAKVENENFNIEEESDVVAEEKAENLENEYLMSKEELISLINTTPTIEESEIPFPQADDFTKVVCIGDLLQYHGGLLKEEARDYLGLVSRQIDYYINAGCYLGIFYVNNGKIELTKEGKNIFALTNLEKTIELIKAIVSHKVFSFVLRFKLMSKVEVEKIQIANIMKAFNLFNINSDDTYLRRASTVNSWTQWILEKIKI